MVIISLQTLDRRSPTSPAVFEATAVPSASSRVPVLTAPGSPSAGAAPCTDCTKSDLGRDTCHAASRGSCHVSPGYGGLDVADRLRHGLIHLHLLRDELAALLANRGEHVDCNTDI